jgi:hypothetical protein
MSTLSYYAAVMRPQAFPNGAMAQEKLLTVPLSLQSCMGLRGNVGSFSFNLLAVGAKPYSSIVSKSR